MELITLVRKGQTETVINTLLDKNKVILAHRDNEAINLLANQLTRANESYQYDLIDRDQYNLEINRINLTLIRFLNNSTNPIPITEDVKNEAIINKKYFKLITQRLIIPLLLSLCTFFFYPQPKDIIHFKPVIMDNTIKFQFCVLKRLTNLDTFDFYFSIRDTSVFKIALHSHNLYPTNLDVTDEIIENNDKFGKFKHQKTIIDLTNETEFGWEIKVNNLTEKKIQLKDFYFSMTPRGKNPSKSSVSVSFHDYINFYPFALPCIIFTLWQIFFSKLHYIGNSIFMKASLSILIILLMSHYPIHSNIISLSIINDFYTKFIDLTSKKEIEEDMKVEVVLVSALTGEPISNGRIECIPSVAGVWASTTSNLGKGVLTPKKGIYQVKAEKTGYRKVLSAQFGPENPDPILMEMHPSESFKASWENLIHLTLEGKNDEARTYLLKLKEKYPENQDLLYHQNKYKFFEN